MWFRAKVRAGGRMQTGIALSAVGLGVGAAILLARRLFRR